MRKHISLLLCAALLLGLAVPAAAEDGADARLARVTQAVKKTLGLNTDAYDSFRGECSQDELAPVWTLRWENGDDSLTVDALEDGTVVSYRRGVTDWTGRGSGIPAFPAGDPAKARAAAQAFLKKVLDPALESVQLGEAEGDDRLEGSSYYFSGTIRLRGLPSPLSFSVTVDKADHQVLRFRRDVPENTWLGDLPAASAAVSQDAAAKTLRGAQTLRLEYVLPEGESRAAVLRYVPHYGGDCYVDAQTGKLENLDEQIKALMNGMEAGAAADGAAPAEAAMTPAEQAGIAELEGVLTKEELDAALRAIPEFGLGRFTLVSASYRQEEGDDGETQILCALRYSRAQGDRVYGRSFTVDARSGAVRSLYSSAPWVESFRPSVSRSQAQAKAEAFLRARYPDHFARLALYETDDSTGEGASAYRFTFARRENDVFFPQNAYRVGVDASDGSICALSFEYDADVTFPDPAGVLSAEAAMDRWMATYRVTLSYLAVPQPLTGSDETTRRLRQMGLTSFYGPKLGYVLEREDAVLGIDARTGEAVLPEQTWAGAAPSYTDLAGSWAKGSIERLAKYGIGYGAPAFQPRKAMTQWELVCLLASLRGLRLDPAEADAQMRDEAYAIAYEMGALTRQARRDDAALSRGALIQILLDAAGYGPAAKLRGIYTCSYTDRRAISQDELGYAAIAQALGLVGKTYAGSRTATRAEAAAILCRLMERK